MNEDELEFWFGTDGRRSGPTQQDQKQTFIEGCQSFASGKQLITTSQSFCSDSLQTQKSLYQPLAFGLVYK